MCTKKACHPHLLIGVSNPTLNKLPCLFSYSHTETRIDTLPAVWAKWQKSAIRIRPSPTACFNPRGGPTHPDGRKMAYAYRRNCLWASESCMSVDKCTRSVGGVRIPHVVCRWRTHTARGVRTPPTVRVHSCTLPTVALHSRTLTHGNRRMETVWRDRDTWRRCTRTLTASRRNAYTTRRSAWT